MSQSVRYEWVVRSTDGSLIEKGDTYRATSDEAFSVVETFLHQSAASGRIAYGTYFILIRGPDGQWQRTVMIELPEEAAAESDDLDEENEANKRP